jgi:hypothetical protein
MPVNENTVALIYLIQHYFDVWHKAKQLGEKLLKLAGKRKELQPLATWASALRNHFWFCSKHCKGNVDVMLVSGTGRVAIIVPHCYTAAMGRDLYKTFIVPRYHSAAPS